LTIECPVCAKKQKEKPLKEWNYGKNTSVKRFKCKCGKFFNFYENVNKTWTTPKKK